MIIEFEEYNQKIKAILPRIEDLQSALNLASTRAEVEELELQSATADFWSDLENSQKVSKRLKVLKDKLSIYDNLKSAYDDVVTIYELATEEEDASLLSDLEEEYSNLENMLEEATLQTLLSGEYDSNNAIISIHAGAAVPRRRIGLKCCFLYVFPLG